MVRIGYEMIVHCFRLETQKRQREHSYVFERKNER